MIVDDASLNGFPLVWPKAQLLESELAVGSEREKAQLLAVAGCVGEKTELVSFGCSWENAQLLDSEFLGAEKPELASRFSFIERAA